MLRFESVLSNESVTLKQGALKRAFIFRASLRHDRWGVLRRRYLNRPEPLADLVEMDAEEVLPKVVVPQEEGKVAVEGIDERGTRADARKLVLEVQAQLLDPSMIGAEVFTRDDAEDGSEELLVPGSVFQNPLQPPHPLHGELEVTRAETAAAQYLPIG